MKIGAQLYTLHEYAKDRDSILDSLEKVKKIGYDSVQLSGIGRMDVNELKAKLDINTLAIKIIFFIGLLFWFILFRRNEG